MRNDEMNKTEDTQRYHVPNLERALGILEYLAECRNGVGLSEIADYLKLPRNSVFRIVKTLCAYDYLQLELPSKTYRLSRKLLAIGYAAMGENNLGEISRDILRELRDQSDETSLLGVLNGTHGIVLDQMPSRQPVKFLVDVGASFPIHTSAPGKAIAAFLPENEQTKLLQELDYKRFTERTVLDEKTLAKELMKVRNKGYAIDQGEAIEGLHCVGGPVLDHRGYPVAAIWITGPAYRLPKNSLDQIAQIVMEEAMVISRRLGYR